MVFERITLIDIYDTLKSIETNENKVSSILINRTSTYGTKTFPRFENLSALKKFINDNYPYRKIDDPEQECFTCNEGLTTLLNFSISDSGDSVFINNLRKGLESAKENVLNKTSKDALQNLFANRTRLENIFIKYLCYTTQSGIESNRFYDTLIEEYYRQTRRPDFPGYRKVIC
jgi:hypothetical protein